MAEQPITEEERMAAAREDHAVRYTDWMPEDGPPPPIPATDADCRLIGAGDGSVMVYCQPCGACLCPAASTINAALGFWEEHQEQAHQPAPMPERVTVADPWRMPVDRDDPPPF